MFRYICEYLYLSMIDNKICKTLIQAIREAKWVYIVYLNKEERETKYWIAVDDIKFDNEEPRLKCHGYNPQINPDNVLDKLDLFLNKIKSATIIDFTHYDVSDSLLKKINDNMGKYSWLNYEPDVKYLLDYYEACNRLDKDPYQKESYLIPGVDLSVLMQNKLITLNKEQKEQVLKIYDEIGRAFEPDFVLFCRRKTGKENVLQIFIEPKGGHLESKDMWKKDFWAENQGRVFTNTMTSH